MSNRVLSGLVASTLAAAAAAGPAAAADSSGTLEEVVVTAQRREANLQDVPVAISAITSDEILAAGITRVSDFANAMPNVFINTGASLRSTVIAVRGISSNPNNPGVDPAVGVYLDGVYMGRPTTINSGLYDVERIEVLRGPQGTLYGKNTIAGAINFITKMPTEELSGEVRLGYGNYDNLLGYAAVSGALSDRLTARLSGSYATRDGYLHNTYTGTYLNDAQEAGGRLVLAYEASDDLDIIVRADVAQNRTNDGGEEIYENGAFAGTPLADNNPDDWKVAYNVDNVADRDQWGTSIEADWTTGVGVLTSITAYREFNWTNVDDNDYTILSLLASGITEDQSQFSQELRLVSDAEGPFEYLVGAHYDYSVLDTRSRAWIGPDLGIYPEEVEGVIRAKVDAESWAIFGQGTYSFSDQWSISGGIRYTDESKDVRHAQVGDPLGILLPTTDVRNLSRGDDKWSPSASLNWQPMDTVLVYVSYANGFKAGGFNVFSITPVDDASYKPEVVDSYEIGIKSTLFDDHARLNIAAYTLDYKDLQVNQLVLVNGVPQFQTSNAATATSTGVEVEFQMQLADGLEMNASYGYLDAKFDRFKNATAQGDDFSGNRLPLAPKGAANLALQYDTTIGDGYGLWGRIEGNWRDFVYFDVDNDPLATQDAYTTLDLRFGLNAKSGWSATVWMRNLTDETYALDRSAGPIVPGQYVQALGPPRTYGLEIGYGF